MQTRTTRILRRPIAGVIASLAAVAGLGAAEPAVKPAAPGSSSATVLDALGAGKVSLHLRARWEHADQDGLDAANALTLRTRLGYTTGAFNGFKLSAEFEDVSALDGDDYNQAGLNPGGAGRTVVADPETTEVNQVWLGYTVDKTQAKLGRQRLVLDNARFVGDVGWRQNMQTFDAFTLQDNTLEGLTLTYAYLWQINRVFGRDHPQGTWDSDSHILHASHKGLPIGTLAAYVHLLDFDDAIANSCATYGASLTGSRKVGADLNLSYRAEYAMQADYGTSPLDYRSDYLATELGLGGDVLHAGLGYEVLGTDNGVGFRTPLATLHAFNGWADVFLTTPNSGLRDAYVKVGATLPRGWGVTAFYHRFETDRGDDLGDEIDLLATWKINAQFSAAAKAARFNSSSLLADVSKFWLQVEFAY